MQFTTRVKTSVPEWKAAVADEDSLARHRKLNPKLHDTLGRIEVMLDREMSAPEFDRDKIKAEILSISDPEKSEILRKQKEAAEAAQREEERIKEEQARQGLTLNVPRFGIFSIDSVRKSRAVPD